MHRTFVRVALASATVVALALSGAAIAPANAQQAAPDLGKTRVAVAPHVVNQLTRAGITPSPVNGAQAFPYKGTLALRFAISNIVGGGNRIKHSGGVMLSNGHESVTLSRFSINLNQGVVSAEINGDSRAALFNLKESNRPELGAVRLTLNRTAAGALNSTFGVHAFKAGQNFGFGTVNAS